MDEYKLPPKTEKPVWILQRQPQPSRGDTYIQIWFKDDGIKISPVKLCKLLADVMQSQTKKEVINTTRTIDKI